MKSDTAKTRGIHYTPPALARFLANVVVEHLPLSNGPLTVLDPACGTGDCYWITLRPSRERSWLLLMLAVANSTFITRYYDIAFHNKLYAGRRRFMTQYVKHFPLPDPDHPLSRRIVELAESLVEAPDGSPRIEDEIDALTWAAFGVRARRP